MMGWNQNSWSWGSGSFGWWGMGLMLIFWALVLGLVVWGIVRLTSGQRHASHTLESPRSLLDRRFASGELDAEQYAEARRLLEGQGVRRTAAGG